MLRGRSSFHTMTGALACVVQSSSSRFAPPSSWRTLTQGSFLTWRMLLAASLHGPGTPDVSTNLKPVIARARSTSIYSAMVHSLLNGLGAAPRLYAAAYRRANTGRTLVSGLCQKSGQKEKPPTARHRTRDTCRRLSVGITTYTFTAAYQRRGSLPTWIARAQTSQSTRKSTERPHSLRRTNRARNQEMQACLCSQSMINLSACC